MNADHIISVNPEQLFQLGLSVLSNPNYMQTLRTSLDQDDNEMVVQILLTCIRNIVTNPLLQTISGASTINDLIDMINVGFTAMGYMVHVKQIVPSELNDYIYYARLTPDGQLLRSQYHPIHLRSMMPANLIPESFQKLYSDQDYLPNIVNVWDRGNTDSLLLLSFQRVNIHYADADDGDDARGSSDGGGSSSDGVYDLD